MYGSSESNNDNKYTSIHSLITKEDKIIENRLAKLREQIESTSIEYRMAVCYDKEKSYLLDLTNTHCDIMNDFIHAKDSRVKRDIINNVANMTLDENNIEKLPNLSMFKNLTVLNISSNKLKTLPQLPKTLIELDVHDNKLISIPSLPKLKILEAYNNRLISLPSLPKLKILDAHNNRIENIEYSQRLRKVNISCNPIKNIVELPKLEHLNIHSTNIKSIDYDYPKLGYLDISKTHIKRFRDMDELEFLIATNCSLKELPQLDVIRTIDINGNKIKRIPFYDSLEKLSMGTDQKSHIRLSRKYKINGVKINKKTQIVLCNFEPQYNKQ